jgi:two-component system, OmpR family, sensor histidine kinase VanS
MKKSIVVKLFAGIGTFVLIFVMLSWLLNDQFLEEYYLNKKKSLLIENSINLNSVYRGSAEDLAIELERLENTLGASLLIRSQEGKIAYSSSSRVVDQRLFRGGPNSDSEQGIPMTPPTNSRMPAFRNSPQGEPGVVEIRGNYRFQIQKDKELKIDFLTMQTTLTNGDTLIMRTPLAAIKESVSIANKFMAITGIITMVFGGLWAYVFSKRFTGPILELNNIAQNMSKLDFKKKCSVISEDEIGQLGQSINYLSTKLDTTISELNDRNLKLQEDIERERKIDEMRKEFVSNVSHEMKTPLSLIQGYAEGLVSDVLDTEEDRNFYCQVIIKEAEKMDKLVRDLLDLSQIESGQFHLEPAVFDISTLVDHVISKYRTILNEKNINLAVDRQGILLVQGDFIRVEQVLTNYLNNALNHVDDKKTIIIKIDDLGEKIWVNLFNSGKHIPEEVVDKIWISFYKVDKARTRDYGGTGLGLSIVRAIQELHGNAYGVENVENGVNFWFELKKAKDE